MYDKYVLKPLHRLVVSIAETVTKTKRSTKGEVDGITRQQRCYLKKRESIVAKTRRKNIRKKKETHKKRVTEEVFLEKQEIFYSYYSLKNRYEDNLTRINVKAVRKKVLQKKDFTFLGATFAENFFEEVKEFLILFNLEEPLLCRFGSMQVSISLI
ncbi:hypothetical protein BD770DRAFT_413553 [Pilaira anomala]|nr:hypothetical protein BD770DRAFT_413553 [Pilaira anomala]